MRRRARIDGNHVAIVQTLRDLGVSVFSTAGVGDGFPDLVCGYHGTHLLELKDGSLSPSRRRLTDDEREWHEAWLGEPVEVGRAVGDGARFYGSRTHRKSAQLGGSKTQACHLDGSRHAPETVGTQPLFAHAAPHRRREI